MKKVLCMLIMTIAIGIMGGGTSKLSPLSRTF